MSSIGVEIPDRRSTAAAQESARPRSSSAGDSIFVGLSTGLAAVVVVLFAALVVLLLLDSWPALTRYGTSFFTTTVWDPVFLEFGSAHFIFGTIVTSLVGLLIATPIAVGAALYVAEYAPEWLREPVSFVTELLAVIPSIIYGLWGFFILAPVMRRNVEPFLQGTIGQVPVIGALFQGPIIGKDMLVAGVILAIMILPTIMAISREIFRAVPDTQREGMLALGSTKWETIKHAVVPYARGGIAGAAGLGLARALGETMAVTMVIGNSSKNISASLFTPGYTMASAIANQFTEADSEMYFSAIVAVAVALLLVTILINVIARILVMRFASGVGTEVGI